MFANRIRFGAAALVISGILFVLYPALRPFSDERSLLGAAAFGYGAWLAAHMLAMVAFTSLPVGLLGLQRSLLGTSAERLLFVALVLSMIGTGFCAAVLRRRSLWPSRAGTGSAAAAL